MLKNVIAFAFVSALSCLAFAAEPVQPPAAEAAPDTDRRPASGELPKAEELRHWTKKECAAACSACSGYEYIGSAGGGSCKCTGCTH